MPKSMDVRLHARLSEVRSMAAMVETFGEDNNLPMRTIFVISLALEELITNTVIHGRFPDIDEPAIVVKMNAYPDLVILVMETNGDRFDPTMDTNPDTDSELESRSVGGLGLHLVKTLADRVAYEYVDDVNRLTLEYDLESEPE